MDPCLLTRRSCQGVKLKELQYVVACCLPPLTEKGSFLNEKRRVEKQPDGKIKSAYFRGRELRVEIRYVLLINDSQEVDGKGWERKSGYRQSTNIHQTGSEGNVAAGVGPPAKGLINDGSVVWRWFLFAVIQLSPRPPNASKVDYSCMTPLIINQTRHHAQEYPCFI